MFPQARGLELRGVGAVPSLDQCGVSTQNVRLWESGDSYCPRKRHRWIPSGLTLSPFPLSFWPPRGKMGQAQLEKDWRGGPEPTCGFGSQYWAVSP